MAIEIVLERVPVDSLVSRGIVIDRRVLTFAPVSVVQEFWRWEDDPDMEPQFLAERNVGTQVRVPFDLGDRPIRIFTVAKTDTGVASVNNILQSAVQTVFPAAPTFTSAAWNSVDEDIDLVFAKQSTGTGDIQVEYKKTSETVWQTHATDFAHNATSGTIVITQETDNADYDLRLKQADLPGYSITRQVTVVGTGGGAGTPPELVSVSPDETAPCEWTITIDWNAGSGAGDYSIERKVQGSSIWGLIASGISVTDYDDVVGGGSVSRTYVYRIKQDDVEGYSNEGYAYIPRCIELP